MNISYNWLKSYINTDLDVHKLSGILTDIGLEVGSVEEVESVKGGLKGIVVGEVLTCEKHPNADKLSRTTVNVGTGEPLPIVCGAPNVAAGQKVIVATVGTTLFMGDDSFTIKKAKIRGEVSEGMICAEDEVGLGSSHDGIMVLDPEAVPGTLASDYFKVESDYMIEVDLTPNRIDAGSHIGVARDLAAYLQQENEDITVNWPSVDDFKVDHTNYTLDVGVANHEACPRYSGVTISGLTVKESPDWLKKRLVSIGMNPINNVVDVTNFVLHELGQPLHAFDGDKIAGNKIVVRTLADGTKFTTLDELDREMSDQDLMICNETDGMCIGGVFGGLDSGVTESTTKIFLESAYFNPVWVRKTARRHQISTDSSFRFERGIDPAGTVYALKRAAMLIKEIAGGEISSEVVDIYPEPVKPFEVEFSVSRTQKIIDKNLTKEIILNILNSLEIKVADDKGDILKLEVPTYRVDVQREADVMEDILRIYGYNKVELSDTVHSTISYAKKPDDHRVKNMVGDLLSAQGFYEIMNNSLTKASYYEGLETFKSEHLVEILNPLSIDLNAMRQTLLFGVLESVVYNQNRRNSDLKLYEFGNCYYFDKKEDLKDGVALAAYSEVQHLALAITGFGSKEIWNQAQKEMDFYDLKAYVLNALKKLGIHSGSLIGGEVEDDDLLDYGMTYLTRKGDTLVYFGKVAKKLQKQFDIDNEVYYADFNWDVVLKEIKEVTTAYKEISKYQEVRRDLALLLDKTTRFEEVEKIAYKTESNLLKEVSLFDVYEGKNLPNGKKSYAVSFILQDENKTLKDKDIDKIMHRLIKAYEHQLDAQLR
ncbi:phenylalanine--tRNA ligase subunit beta [Saccharicrinis sp. FJH62]|uniref:phenylalanine--tRNA ligase subunit beta n=1 Tax=Saccharicrinis sp. FJH62 TaxID=3344657 RepID=UPI0035D45072